MKKIKLLIIPILIIGFLFLISNVNAEEEKWYIKASRIQIADSLESWLKVVIWENEDKEIQLKAIDAWIRIQSFTSGDNTSINRHIPPTFPKGLGWTKMGGQSE